MSGRFRFDEFELNVDEYALWRGGQRVKLEKLPMEVLILLVERAGALVDRAGMHDALWPPGVFVERDAAINTAVRKIRQALGDDAARPRLIETVVGKGYRFAAHVERCVPSLDRPARGQPFPSYCVMRGASRFVLDAGENELGRDSGVAVRIDHPSVSRRHARISIGPSRVVLEDLGSRNGTYVDGRRIETATEIGDGAIVGLGPILVTFVMLTASATTQSLTRDPR